MIKNNSLVWDQGMSRSKHCENKRVDKKKKSVNVSMGGIWRRNGAVRWNKLPNILSQKG